MSDERSLRVVAALLAEAEFQEGRQRQKELRERRSAAFREALTETSNAELGRLVGRTPGRITQIAQSGRKS